MNSKLKQQINLYQPHSKSGPYLSFERVLLLWLGLIVILFVMILGQKWDLHIAIKENTNLMQKQQKINEQLVNLSVKKKITNTKPKESPIVTIAKEIEEKQTLIQLLIHNKKVKTFPLSAYLSGLVLTHVNGTFLSYIHASENEDQIAFSGIALEAQLVPMMLAAWQKVPALQEKQFNKVSLHRLGEKKPWVQFDLRAQ